MAKSRLEKLLEQKEKIAEKEKAIRAKIRQEQTKAAKAAKKRRDHGLIMLGIAMEQRLKKTSAEEKEKMLSFLRGSITDAFSANTEKARKDKDAALAILNEN